MLGNEGTALLGSRTFKPSSDSFAVETDADTFEIRAIRRPGVNGFQDVDVGLPSGSRVTPEPLMLECPVEKVPWASEGVRAVLGSSSAGPFAASCTNDVGFDCCNTPAETPHVQGLAPYSSFHSSRNLSPQATPSPWSGP